MNFDELQKSGEGQNLEFKTSFGKETTETVVAFCNTSGGTLLIGVDKTGAVKGVTVNGEILKEWVNTIKQATQPQIYPEIIPMLVLNLRKIGLVRGEQLTFAALLLFGEHQTGIHIGRFKTPDVIVDDILIKIPIKIPRKLET